jgi:hypothetical protein
LYWLNKVYKSKKASKKPRESEITKGYSSLLILNLTAANIEGFAVKSKFGIG